MSKEGAPKKSFEGRELTAKVIRDEILNKVLPSLRNLEDMFEALKSTEASQEEIGVVLRKQKFLRDYISEMGDWAHAFDL